MPGGDRTRQHQRAGQQRDGRRDADGGADIGEQFVDGIQRVADPDDVMLPNLSVTARWISGSAPVSRGQWRGRSEELLRASRGER